MSIVLISGLVSVGCSSRYVGREPSVLLSAVCTLSSTCSKYLLEKVNERAGPCLLQLLSAQSLRLCIFIFPGAQSTYNKYPMREDREHLPVPPRCGRPCSSSYEGCPAESGKETAVAKHLPPVRPWRMLAFVILFYVTESSHR